MIDVIITEDHQLIRSGLKALLNEEPDIEVVGEAANSRELMHLLDTIPASLLLLKLDLSQEDGYSTMGRIKKHYPNLKVLVMSMEESKSQVLHLMEAGAMGYLITDSGKQELISAIRLVASGHYYLCSDVVIKLLKDTAKSSQDSTSTQTALSENSLSKRELEILKLICEGFTNAEIAQKLSASKRTIEKHRQNLLSKSGTNNTATLVRWAIHHNLNC